MGLSSFNTPITGWQDQRVWVIGASSGIGAALARQLLANGARVILSARRTDLLEHVAGAHPRALVATLDVQNTADWLGAYRQIQQRFNGVDLVIFCAAAYRPERSWEVVPEAALQMLAINVGSVYTGLATVLPDMMQRRTGGVALVASVAGYMGLPTASVYGPSKAALINLAEVLYGDLHSLGMNVYLINPGFVETELTQKNDYAMPALQTPDQAALAILHGMKRGQFEIHFPKRFTRVLKLVQCLPYRLRFFLFKRFLA